MREQQQPPDGGDWFDELTGEGEAAPDDGTPTDFLRRIMADETQTGTARVAAAKVLMDRGVGTSEDAATVAMARQVRELTSEQLDAELARFMQDGTPPPDGGLDAYLSKLIEHERREAGDRPLPMRWEREVRRRVGRRVRKIAADFDRRVEAAVLAATSQAVESPSTAEEQQVAVVVPLHLRSRGERTPSEQMDQDMIDSRRAELPPGQQQHVPPGLDPRAVGRAWGSRRP
jgi:hypothetical protein